MEAGKSAAAIHGAKKGKHVTGKLSARFVQTVKFPPKWHSDGAGLYLRVTKEGNKSWVFIFPWPGFKHPREMGLGSYPKVSLEAARRLAGSVREDLINNVDPIKKREDIRKSAQLASAKSMTFDECAKAYIEANRSGWKNDKHAAQWETTLEQYASPVIGTLPVSAIDTGLVLKVLERDDLWTTKAETASRLRGRIEAVLGWATVRGYRTGDNPAAWRNHLDKVLPARSSVKRVEHHEALPYRAIGAFIASLRDQVGAASRALEFAILTAARTGEVIGATWLEFDLDAGTWTIPAERMKAGKEHLIPLSPRALALVKDLLPLKAEDAAPVFLSPKGKALSNMAMLAVLRRMKREDLTVHGFRSTFRDWSGETTAYPREVIEHALAHQLKDKAEAAYARGTLFEKRRRLMDEWATYCSTFTKDAAEVIPISVTAAA